MLSSRRLNKVDYFGKDFEPGEEEIHILVELPPVAAPSLTSTSVNMNPDAAAQESLEAYKQAAERLKDDRAVSQLVAAVRYVAKDTQARPFIVLESSSGMGKTQMAFNLMARDEIETRYVVCERGVVNPQDVYSAFKARSATFHKCIESDLERGIGQGEIPDNPESLHLYTFEFVRALLTGAEEMAPRPCSYKDACDLIKTRTKQPVVFLDEFPLLEQEESEVKLRFMRNMFRILRLPVILSSTNGTARNMIVTGNRSSRGKIHVLWCVVVPEMPPLQEPTLKKLPRQDIAKLVEHSRPLFARFTLKHIQGHKLPASSADGMQIIDYMDYLAYRLARACRLWKASSSSADWFRVGQLCLFLSANFYESTSVTTHLIQGHFARLQDPKMFELRFADQGQFEKWELEEATDGGLVGKQPPKENLWHVRTVFPPIDQDVLLYLSLLGGKTHHAFTNSKGLRVPFNAALDEFNKSSPKLFDFSNPNQASNDGKRLEAVTVAAMVSASHCNGFAGIPLDAFLLEMVYELGMGRPESADVMCKLIPSSLRSRIVPFLAPPDTKWPDWLPRALNLGAIARTTNEERLDFEIKKGWVTGECKDRGRFTGECKDHRKALDLSVMKSILERIPAKSEVHVVVTNRLQGKYFKQESFEDFLAGLKKRKPPLDLTDALFLQYGSDGVMREVGGMQTKARDGGTCGIGGMQTKGREVKTAATTARRGMKAASKARRGGGDSKATSAPKRLVLFVARPIAKQNVAKVEMQDVANERETSPQVKKRRTSGDGAHS